MNENMALLSQKEIDTLVSFLTQERKIDSGVLDQDSIDKLISLLRSGTLQKLQFDSRLPKTYGGSGTAILILDGEDNLKGQQEFCRLETEIDSETDYIHIICINYKTNTRYEMTPTCLEQVRYVSEDDVQWGYAIPPLTFDKVANLLQVKYTKATFDFICERFAEKLLGDKTCAIPSIYMPSANDLIQHLGKELD